MGHDAGRCERVIVEALRLFEIAHGERYVVQQRTARWTRSSARRGVVGSGRLPVEAALSEP